MDNNKQAISSYELSAWINGDAIETAKGMIPSCPREILVMATALVNLEITTRDHAADLIAHGFILRSEEATQLANYYRETLDEICRIWNQ